MGVYKEDDDLLCIYLFVPRFKYKKLDTFIQFTGILICSSRRMIKYAKFTYSSFYNIFVFGLKQDELLTRDFSFSDFELVLVTFPTLYYWPVKLVDALSNS